MALSPFQRAEWCASPTQEIGSARELKPGWPFTLGGLALLLPLAQVLTQGKLGGMFVHECVYAREREVQTYLTYGYHQR